MCCKNKLRHTPVNLNYFIITEVWSNDCVTWSYSLKNSYIGRTKVFLTSKCLYVFVI